MLCIHAQNTGEAEEWNLDKAKIVDEQLHDILNSMGAVIWSARLPGIEITYLSPSAKQLFGCETEKLSENGQIWMNSVHPDDVHIFLEGVEKATHYGDASIEHRIVGPDKKVYWIQNQLKVDFDNDNKPVIINGVMIEETSLKKSEDGMRQSKERLKSILKVAPTGIGVVSNRIITEVNPLACEMTGYSRAELIGSSSRIFYPSQEEFEHVGKEKYQQIQKNGTGTVETRWKRKDGKIIDVLLSSTPIDSSDNSHGVTFTALDITRRKLMEKNLADTNEKYSLMLEKSPMSTLLTRNGKIIYGNPLAAKILGYDDPENIIGIKTDDLIAPELTEHILKRQQNLSKGEANPLSELKIIQPDGKERFVESASVPITLEDGNASLIMSVDITEKKKAKDKLRQNEKFLRKIFDVLPMGLWIANNEGKLISANPAGKNIWGTEPHVGIEEYGIFKARRYPSMEELAPEDWALAHTIREGVTIENELLEIDTFDGKKKIILNHTAPVIDDNEQMLGAIIVNEDVTEKTKIYRELKEHNSFLNTLLNTIPDPVYYKDKNLVYTGCNKAFAREVIGTSRDKIVGKKLRDMNYPISKELVNEYEDLDKEIIITGTNQSYDIEIPKLDGTVKTFINSKAAIYDSNGEITGLIGAMLDITDRKKVENEILHAKIEAEAASRTKSEFLTTISHELRTPLNAIIGYSDILIEGNQGELNEKQERYSRHIHTSGTHLLDLINDILDISKIESGKLDLHYEGFFIKDLMGNVENIVKPLAMKKQIKLDFQIHDNKLSIKADRIKLKQILYNLTSNAIKFTPKNGSVKVITKQTGKNIDIIVKDNGIGISEENQKKLFAPFYQVDSSCSREYQGTGLGLSLVKKLASLHGGEVTLKSILGEGSTFTITIPIEPDIPIDA